MNISKVTVKIEAHDDFHTDNGIRENAGNSEIPQTDPLNLPKQPTQMPSPYSGRTQRCHVCPKTGPKSDNKIRSQYMCCLCKLPTCIKLHLFTLCTICYETKKTLIHGHDSSER